MPAGTRLSQIAPAVAPPAPTDVMVGVTSPFITPADNIFTMVQVTAGLGQFTSTLQGAVPASGGGTTNFLRADGTWAPAGSASAITVGVTPIIGGVSGQVVFDNAGLFGEATSALINSNQFNCPSGKSYLYNGTDVMHSVTGNNFFDGGSGNFTVTGTDNNGTGTGALAALTTGIGNMASGTNAGSNCTSGQGNVFIGSNAGSNVVTTNGNTLINSPGTPGQGNVGIKGCQGTGGSFNVAIGNGALISLQLTGDSNTAIGANCLLNCSTGAGNMAIGNTALGNLTTGNTNVGLGPSTGRRISTGSNNVCIGNLAGQFVVANDNNCCIGSNTMGSADGNGNVFIGTNAGGAATGSGYVNNTVIGTGAGVNMTGSNLVNTLIGSNAGSALTTGTRNTIIGNNAATTTMSSTILIADGFGNIGWQSDPTNGVFIGNNATFLIRALTTLSAGSTANAPTLTAGPVNGNPTKWFAIDDNGVTRFIPSW